MVRSLDLDVALIRDLARAVVHDLIEACGLVRDINARDFIEAPGNLANAATDFVGADLTTVDPGEVTLAGIRWDGGTVAPTPVRAARIRRGSVEDPLGSGLFIVRPEGRILADLDSLTSI
ncbi:hypothetical protein [Streptomyces umbrinus]|uniref:hypothetical protein n=1 Tax=Streptomyces umbrinus TaxID=67370 RepID=UPI0033CB654D